METNKNYKIYQNKFINMNKKIKSKKYKKENMNKIKKKNYWKQELTNQIFQFQKIQNKKLMNNHNNKNNKF